MLNAARPSRSPKHRAVNDADGIELGSRRPPPLLVSSLALTLPVSNSFPTVAAARLKRATATDSLKFDYRIWVHEAGSSRLAKEYLQAVKAVGIKHRDARPQSYDEESLKGRLLRRMSGLNLLTRDSTVQFVSPMVAPSLSPACLLPNSRSWRCPSTSEICLELLLLRQRSLVVSSFVHVR